MDKILITGVSGFLGANIALKLLSDDNCIVYGYDYLETSDISSLYLLLKNDRFNFIQSEINNLDLPYVDKIVHCIGSANINNYYKNNYNYIFNELNVLKRILEYTKKFSSKSIFLSEIINKNEYNNDLELYFELLNISEKLINSYKKSEKISSCILRMANTYGFSYAKQNFNNIEQIIYDSILNKNIEIDYDSVDYYVYIEDVVEIISDLLTREFDFDIMEISAKDSIELADIVNFIIDETKSNSEIKYKSDKKIYPAVTPDLEIMNKLGYTCSDNYMQNLSNIISKIRIGYFS